MICVHAHAHQPQYGRVDMRGLGTLCAHPIFRTSSYTSHTMFVRVHTFCAIPSVFMLSCTKRVHAEICACVWEATMRLLAGLAKCAHSATRVVMVAMSILVHHPGHHIPLCIEYLSSSSIKNLGALVRRIFTDSSRQSVDITTLLFGPPL